jgi:hypothetical protein
VKAVALAAVALAALPACAQEAPSAPPPAAAPLGPTASVVRAIAQGDAAALERATRGSISNRLTYEARGSGLVPMSAAELIALTRGCTAEDPKEPDASGPGGVGYRCAGRQALDIACNDVGYGLLIRAGPGFARVSVWPNDGWSRARCGEMRPPPPVRLPPRGPAQ